MYLIHNLFGGGRPSDAQDLGVRIGDNFFLRSHAAGNQYLAILGNRLADGVQRFLFRAIDEAAGIHHNQVSVVVTRHDVVAVRF